MMPLNCSSEWAQAKGLIKSIFFFKHFVFRVDLLMHFAKHLPVVLETSLFCWTDFMVGMAWCSEVFFFEVLGCAWHGWPLCGCLPSLCSPDCIQSIAAVWRTVRETERGRGREWCTTTPLTASQWDSTWELPSAPCAWILCTLVAKPLPVSVSYTCVPRGQPWTLVHFKQTYWSVFIAQHNVL